MIGEKTVLAYIPARSGSKSIRDKNIVDLGGKPLIAYSIIPAKNSKYVDRIIISTDSQKYADIAKEFGAEAPFLRPKELCGDRSIEMDAAIHLINWVEEKEKKSYDIFIKLEPTSPLRNSEDIDKAIELLIKNDANTVISVAEAMTPPVWMNTLPADRCLKNFISKENLSKNRQELETYYLIDGVVYVAKWDFIKKNKTWFDDNSYATITPQERCIDIDGPIQLELARILVKKNEK